MANRSDARVILIAGPTASGKSALALALAEEIGAEIVNADALQVYRDLLILSARPTPVEEARRPHHLFGHVDGGIRYSVGGWARDAAAALDEIAERGAPAIVVGGTGLYFRALTEGLAEAPAVPAAVRREAEERLAAVGLPAFRAEVIAADPAMARLKPGDRQRHVRAWEVFHATGRPLSEFQAGAALPVVAKPAARLVLEPPREDLYRTIDGRFDAMMAAGALEEARALAARGLDESLPVMKAVGVAELLAHLNGRLTREEAVRLARQSSRRYAKRQLTWFRNQTPGWPRAASANVGLEALGRQLGKP
ncbi:MAG: tRNA (adenosine(37)-N6)-dimethylallyltransferase MiaA [Parvularculaceae bacterium]